ncbi:HAD family hydrolase [Sporosarcina psychrophila]|uniref:HAD family hydrolase n=1 Tax=Sporosarcina psychrophila TaxID=1476 RepID=UPI00078E5A6C|nr:HAD family hydrolase [Sporosarcina psychrophila]AMQ07865.1 HAD family hydrolase [Sporosarcina psychrophila]
MDSIIFDLDGTLWDSRKTVAKSWSEVVKSSPDGIGEITEEDLKATMGLQIKDIAKIVFGYLDETKQMELILDCCHNERLYLLDEGGQLFPGLEEVLQKLSERYKLFIVSNCQEGYIEAFYEYHGLKQYFQDFENPGRTGLSKGENIQLVIERNQLKSPVYVGDTQSDKDATEYAKVPFVYAAYGFGQVEVFNYKIDNFEELINLFM